MRVPASKRRPRDRKQRILAAAAAQFWAHGYHQVTMADIATELGVATSALYRHYPGKQDLLVQVLNEALDHLAPDTLDRDLDTLVDCLASVVLQRREFGALWDRENGHLPDRDRAEIADRLRTVVTRTAAAIGRRRPADTADVLVSCAGNSLKI